jgi:hypothetical protein
LPHRLPPKNVLAPKFFLPFPLPDVLYIGRGLCPKLVASPAPPKEIQIFLTLSRLDVPLIDRGGGRPKISSVGKAENEGTGKNPCWSRFVFVFFRFRSLFNSGGLDDLEQFQSLLQHGKVTGA